MDLINLIGEGELNQDEWSLTKPTFGEDSQLTIIGWAGRANGGKGGKYYILFCTACSQDPELFGEGYFRSLKSNLIGMKAIPCGCGNKAQYNVKQYHILCDRQATMLGYTFKGFVGDWKGCETKISMLCKKHGEWNTGSVLNLLNKQTGCRLCGDDVAREFHRKSDDVMIASFFASGSFHPATKFWRSARKSSDGYTPYWNMFCPRCETECNAYSVSLQLGSLPCKCSQQCQQECYINWVVDDFGKVVAIKFGIAINSLLRSRVQNRYSVYKVTNYLIYKFPTVVSCKQAERDCKRRLECGILSKEEMPDGWTETTAVSNLFRVIQIFQDNGGVLCETL